MADVTATYDAETDDGDATLMTTYVSTITYLYLAIGFGTILTLYLFFATVGPWLSPGLGGIGVGTSTLATVVGLAWAVVIVLGPVVTGVLSFVVGRDLGSSTTAAVTGAAANLVGVVVTMVLLLLCMLVLSGTTSAVEAVGALLVAAMAVGVGIGVTGAAGGALGARVSGG